MKRERVIQDITGQRYGRLVAVRFDHYNEKKQDCWLFRCDCGNEKIIPAANVKWRRVQSCGCLIKEHITALHKQDITGKRYGRLTAIRPTDQRDVRGSIIWECRCDCGNTVFYSVSCLAQGRTKSCGCLYAETRSTSSQNRTDAVDGTFLSILVASKELRPDNSSGHTGVCYNKVRDNWKAYIDFQKQRINIGEFKNKEEAIRARKAMETRLHDSFISKNLENLSEYTKGKWNLYAGEKVQEE